MFLLWVPNAFAFRGHWLSGALESIRLFTSARSVAEPWKTFTERYHKLVAELLTAIREPNIGISDAFLAGRGAGRGERRDAGLED